VRTARRPLRHAHEAYFTSLSTDSLNAQFAALNCMASRDASVAPIVIEPRTHVDPLACAISHKPTKLDHGTNAACYHHKPQCQRSLHWPCGANETRRGRGASTTARMDVLSAACFSQSLARKDEQQSESPRPAAAGTVPKAVLAQDQYRSEQLARVLMRPF